MLALAPFLSLLLLSQTSIASHLPSRLDPARIRSVKHRRHHARRALADCDGANIATGGAPVTEGRRDDAVGGSLIAVVTNSTGSAGNGTSAVLPGTSSLVAGSGQNGTSEVGEMVKDAVEDVVSPALANALNLAAVGTTTVSDDKSVGTPSNGVFVVDPADIPSPDQRATSNSVSSATSQGDGSAVAPVVAATCNQGDWKCDGMTLKQCNWNNWLVVRQCTGDNIICSDQGSTVGCVWTWSVAQQATPSSSPSPASSNVQVAPVVQSPQSQAATTAQPTSVVQASPSPSPKASSAASPTVSLSYSSTGTSPASSSTFINDKGEECVEWEEEVWEEEEIASASSTVPKTSATATSTSTVSSVAWTSMPASSAVATSVAAASSSASSAADDEDCEEWEDESSASSSTSVSFAASSSAAVSQLGNNLVAGPKSSSASSAASASPRGSSSWSSSPTSTQLSSTTSTTSTTTMTSASATSMLETQHAIAATISASAEVLSNLTNPSKTLSIIDVSAIGISSFSTASPTTKGVVTATPSSIDRYSAPHYVIYSDYWLFSMPDVSTLKAFNRFVLAFWMSDQGPVDNAQMWVWMPQADRRRVLDAYHNAGIALMVSAFGSTDQPTTWGKDPLATAQQLAKFVVDYEFDGVDIDYEDMGAMNSDQAERWLIPFQKELRRLLPKPYLISHAPVAPWFTSSSAYRSGAYVAIHQSVGDGIDFYNMQFYNQGDGVYADCNSLINSSGGYWPGTSVMEMNSYAKVPLNKIVIGKPLDAGKASNGYMSPQDLNVCVKQARGKGWNGGVMFWEWTTDAPGIMAAARA